MKATRSEDSENTSLDEWATLLTSAVVSDACDAHGHLHSHLSSEMTRLAGVGTVVGWIRTAVSRPDPALDREYAQEISFLDSLRPGDVVVARCEMTDTGFWGELFSAAALGRGSRGALVDGYVRDIDGVRALGFPLHARGMHPGDCAGRVSIQEVDSEVHFGEVTVRSGDLVVADSDGAVVVPKELVAEVIPYALDKVAREKRSLQALLDGALLAETWAQEGVL